MGSYHRTITEHTQTTSFPSVVERTASPAFAPPVPMGMQEPGTNWFTIVTAEGPHTVEKPGITGGFDVQANNARPKTTNVPLTRKGG